MMFKYDIEFCMRKMHWRISLKAVLKKKVKQTSQKKKKSNYPKTKCWITVEGNDNNREFIDS